MTALGNLLSFLQILPNSLGNITNITYICNVIKTVTRKEYKTKDIKI